MKIRKSKISDLVQMVEIYNRARRFMAENGNPKQWGDGYPKQELLEQDIKDGTSYVCVDDDGTVLGTFMFFIGNEHTYNYIEDGKWPDDDEYGTIHRLASSGSKKGVAKACIDYCKTLVGEVRGDTHCDNTVMQKVFEKCGFNKCGRVYMDDGSARIAYWFKK